MVTVNLSRGEGKGTYKESTGVVSLSNGDTITVKFANIESVSLTAEAASGNYVIANVISISGNTVTVGLSGAASATAPSTLTSAVNVHYAIRGY